MKIISGPERGLFLSFFNRGGYVLDFSTNDFDNFTFMSIGVALCDKYEMSKGKSLTAFSTEATEEEVVKLFVDLFDHYEASRLLFREEEINDDYFKMYKRLVPIVERIRPYANSSITTILLSPIKDIFNSEYISSQVDDMIALEESNPTDCIGKAKELIESCCITIFEKLGKERDKNWDLNKLITETTNLLNLSPKGISNEIALSSTIKQILQSLRSIAGGLAELRNPYGSGHGKSASFKGLEKRHAKLAVGASATLVNFLWDSYLLQYGI